MPLQVSGLRSCTQGRQRSAVSKLDPPGAGRGCQHCQEDDIDAVCPASRVREQHISEEEENRGAIIIQNRRAAVAHRKSESRDAWSPSESEWGSEPRPELVSDSRTAPGFETGRGFARGTSSPAAAVGEEQLQKKLVLRDRIDGIAAHGEIQDARIVAAPPRL